MHLSTLLEWLHWIEKVHSSSIDLGLERVSAVARRLDVLSPPCTTIIVGGTNGKGSTVFGLESIYRAANYKTGSFTSPYLFQYNEQIRINGQIVDDQEICAAFAKVEAVRKEIPLTPFEFCTLASLYLFRTHTLDVLILEVGLGGRLDAVNIIDADIAIVTSIGIDHTAWLGHSREQIGFEKAGIFRPRRPAICGDFDPPSTIIEAATDLGALLYYHGRDFDYEEAPSSWSWSSQTTQYENLPTNSLATQNMSTVLMAVTLLQHRLPVTRSTIEAGLTNVKLPGRIQIINGPITKIFDVSHNPAAITFLQNKLGSISSVGKTHAVFSMLADKDIVSSILAIRNTIEVWHVAPLQTKRAATEAVLKESFCNAKINNVFFYSSIGAAYDNVLKMAKTGDRVIVFGSFHTVAEVGKKIDERLF